MEALFALGLALLADLPPEWDVTRFPTRPEANEATQFNRGVVKWLEERRATDHIHFDELTETIRQTHRLYEIWDLVRDARCEFYSPRVRRMALAELRQRLGDEAYYAGRLPPPVPVWRFAEVGR